MPRSDIWISSFGGTESNLCNLSMQIARHTDAGHVIAGGFMSADSTRQATLFRMDDQGEMVWKWAFAFDPESYCNDINLGDQSFITALQIGHDTGLTRHDLATGRVIETMRLRHPNGLSVNVSSFGSAADLPIFSGQIGAHDFFHRENQGLIGKPGSWAASVGKGPAHASLFANAGDGHDAVYTVGLWHDERITGRIGGDAKLRMQQNMLMRWRNVQDSGQLEWAVAIEQAGDNDRTWIIAWFNVVCDGDGNAVIIGEDNDEKVTIAKVDRHGQVLWLTRMNNGANNGGYPGLHIDENGDVLACGQPGYEILTGGYILSYKLSGRDGRVIWQRLLTHDSPLALFLEFGVRCLGASGDRFSIAGWRGHLNTHGQQHAVLTYLPTDGSALIDANGWRSVPSLWTAEYLDAKVEPITPPVTACQVNMESDAAVLHRIEGVKADLTHF